MRRGPPDLVVDVNQLVLDGFDPRDAEVVVDGLRDELRRVFDGPAQGRSPATSQVDSVVVGVESPKGRAVGRAIADAVHGTVRP